MRPLGWTLFAGVWLVAVGGGMRAVLAYEYTPGTAAQAPASWPADTAIPAPRERPTLVLLMHPQCSCSRATLAELARLMARVQGRLDAYVLVLDPFGGRDAAWVQSDLWTTASSIPGVRVLRDPAGGQARRFGAFTSGQVVLYDASGRLRFAGGITDARGHEGDNAGRAALEDLLLREAASRTRTAVFGCGLFAS